MGLSRAAFEAKIDRSGEHHRWVGARSARGVGQVRVDGRLHTATKVAWELEHGSLPPGARVRSCPADPACVRVEHLSVAGVEPPTGVDVQASAGRRRSTGSMRQLSPGRWELSVTLGRHDDDGSVRRAFRRVDASSERAAAKALASFVAEAHASPPPANRADRSITVDAAVEQFLTEHLLGEKGREPKTVSDYRLIHAKWFAPEIGGKPLRSIDEATMDRLFGRMARAGLSRSRMNQAKALYRPFFRWCRSRRLIERNPMADFQLPTARTASKERVPPEVHEMVLLLETAAEVVPDVLPILTLGAVTGMRRGELLGLRRSRLHVEAGRIVVDAAIDEGKRVKTTKTRRERTFHVDAETMRMLVEHCDQLDEKAASVRVPLAADPFVFSLALDCSTPIPPDHLTRRVSALKEHLGIADKRPETVALEDEALRLFRQQPSRRDATSGPVPKGGLSYAEIGRRLDRSDRWVAGAIKSAQRREQAAASGIQHSFDGSILALRKFTSTELLDAGFNISMVAQRQGHGPGVLVRHYAKARESADRKAAAHLGNLIHGCATRRSGPEPARSRPDE